MTTFCKHQKLLITLVALLCFSVKSIGQHESLVLNKSTEEIWKVEKQFEADLNKFGPAFAFEKYAAQNAVIKRNNDTLIFGPKAIKEFYSADNYKNAKASWSPDFIDISPDGTMAYTYGKYEWTITDKPGKSQKYNGIFHTVWKKQTNGSWKYVWD